MVAQRTFKPVFTTPFFQIEASSPDTANSKPHYRLRQPDSVICCVLDHQGHFILVLQDRPNLGYRTMEFPAGAIEPNETPDMAAVREFQEETGLQANMVNLGRCRLLMNRSVNQDHIFFGMTVETSVPTQPEAGIDVLRVSRDDLIAKIKSGDFEQLAGLGILQKASLILGVDVLHAPLDEIKDSTAACAAP